MFGKGTSHVWEGSEYASVYCSDIGMPHYIVNAFFLIHLWRSEKLTNIREFPDQFVNLWDPSVYANFADQKILENQTFMFDLWSVLSLKRFIVNKEAAPGGVLWEKVFSEILQNSQENTCARVSFLIKLQASECNFVWHVRVFPVVKTKVIWRTKF